MAYISFRRPDGTPSYGRVDDDRVIDLGGAAGAPIDLKAAIAGGAVDDLTGSDGYALVQIELLPVIPNPGKILCVGHNYETHRAETGRAKVAHPSIFIRFADTLVADGQPIIRPSASNELDYEAEIAIVIGEGGRGIAERDAIGHIAGYACFNDASIRDWQWHTTQFGPGKNFPGTGGFGPRLVTPAEAGDLADVRVISRLNGKVMQDQPVRDMLFPIARIIEYVSSFTPLSPGDVIATGTPGGVGAKRQPPVWMKPGDVIEIEAGPMGTLTNTIVQEGQA